MVKNTKVKRFYIEFILMVENVETENQYIIQSKWFNTKAKALKWFITSFDYVDLNIVSAQLMTAIFNEDNYDIIEGEDIKKILSCHQKHCKYR